MGSFGRSVRYPRSSSLLLALSFLGCDNWTDAAHGGTETETRRVPAAAARPAPSSVDAISDGSSGAAGTPDSTEGFGGGAGAGNSSDSENATEGPAPPVEYVLLITVDGLAARFLETMIGEGYLPAFRQLQESGAWTHNARTDFGYSVTLPNHTTVFTGRPVTANGGGVASEEFHGFSSNSLLGPEMTLHSAGNPALAYVEGVFDIVHDHGLRTCFFAGKDKFVIFTRSWGEDFGAPDLVGADNGRSKLDRVLIANGDTPTLTEALMQEQASSPCNLSYLHFADADAGGHAMGWGSDGWLQILRDIDVRLGQLMRQIATDTRLRGKTALILTADHGGEGTNHSDAASPNNHTIPFYVMGPGIPKGADLYEVLDGTRTNPGTSRPTYGNAPADQPLRNGDASALVLELLGLPPLPGATMRYLGMQRTLVED